MVTCHPDVSFATVKCAQANATPAEVHFCAAKYCMRYLYVTLLEGIYFWRTTPRHDLPDLGPPTQVSTDADLLLIGHQHNGPCDLHAFTDADWAACPKTRRSFSGICLRLACGIIAYKTRFQPTVAMSSIEPEFMAASNAAKMLLYTRSILYDLRIPQDTASIVYEDNNEATAMTNAVKPTKRTRHIDVRYFDICDWVECDLVILERV